MIVQQAGFTDVITPSGSLITMPWLMVANTTIASRIRVLVGPAPGDVLLDGDVARDRPVVRLHRRDGGELDEASAVLADVDELASPHLAATDRGPQMRVLLA